MGMNTNGKDLANIIFCELPDHASIDISIPGLGGTKELFMFCLDLFMRGLTLLYGRDTPTGRAITLTAIDDDMFGHVAKRMSTAGIMCYKRSVVDSSTAGSCRHNLATIKDMEKDKPLCDYKITVECMGYSHAVWFGIEMSPAAAIKRCGSASEH